MKSILVKDTTREEREQIVAESIGNINGACDGCAAGLAEMYQDYIDGKREIRDINREFSARYEEGAGMPERNKYEVYEKSCGAVIYTEKDGRRLYLIELMQKGHRSICKGHVEKDETERQTAEREIREETGLTVCFLDGFRETIEYSPYEGCMKTVVFFLAKADSTEVTAQEEEVREISWLPFEEAVEALTFESDRDTLRKADAFLAL